MTTLDELQRAVERLTADLTANHAMTLGGAVVRTSDLRLLLSERAELLANVERMRAVESSQKPVPMTAQDLADHAADAFDNALPDDALPHDIGRAWKAVGERLAAILAERAEE